MSLEKFGWNSYFESEFSRFAGAGREPARVALADREHFVVWSESGEREATVAGRLRYESGDWPTVGDWVALEAGTRISAVLPRQSVFSRKEAGAVTREQVLAANIDVLFAVTGSSGAGKSTLVNRLLGYERQPVQEVRADDSRGRHTTVRREMFLAPAGWLLVDTPGLRELQLWATPASVDLAFDDIADLATQCRFRDCRHQGEPGCAVATSGIDESRLASYAKLQRELAHLDRKMDQRYAQEEK